MSSQGRWVTDTLPDRPSGINWASDQARGLYRAYVPMGDRPGDVLTGRFSNIGAGGDPFNGPMVGVAGIGRAAYINSDANAWDLASGNTLVSLAAGADYTFTWVGVITAWDTGNPGFWRAGGEFNIFQTTTGRPWVRVNNADALKPTSGYAISTGVRYWLAFRIRSGTDAAFFVNGVLRHSNTHALTTTAVNVRYLGQQLSETVFGYYSDVRFYTRALSDVEIYKLWHPDTRWDLYARTRRVRPPKAAPAAAVTPSLLTLNYHQQADHHTEIVSN